MPTGGTRRTPPLPCGMKILVLHSKQLERTYAFFDKRAPERQRGTTTQASKKTLPGSWSKTAVNLAGGEDEMPKNSLLRQ